MPEITRIKYEFSDYDEASSAMHNWSLAPRGNPDNVPYPKFEIDWIDVELHDKLVIWLKLKKED